MFQKFNDTYINCKKLTQQHSTQIKANRADDGHLINGVTERFE